METIHSIGSMTGEDTSLSRERTSFRGHSICAWLLSILAGVAAFLLPALWNGFALVFFDTGGYIDRVTKMGIYPGRSFFYGFFLWAASLGWWSFWGPIAIQSLLSFWVIHLMLRSHRVAAGPRAAALFCLGLSGVTGISWYTSQLMPDILVPLAILALWLLSSSWITLRKPERVGLFALALLGMVSHSTCLALAIGLIPTILILRLYIYRDRKRIAARLLPPVAVMIAGLVLIPIVNFSLSGKLTYSTGGPVFLFARLVQAGIAQQWLKNNCPLTNLGLCSVRNQLPKNADEFLWSVTSPFKKLGGWSGKKANDEFGEVVVESIKEYPGEVLETSVEATMEQFLMVETGDGLDNYQDYTRLVFSQLPPHTYKAFKAAKQQKNKITQDLFDKLDLVHIPVAYLSVLGLLATVGWGLRKKRPELAGLALFVLIALMGNAFICGALSSPFDRYQSRLVWLATLVVGMAGIAAVDDRKAVDGGMDRPTTPSS